MSTKILLVVASLALSILIGLSLARGNRATQPAGDKQLLIGLSLDTLKEARWQADRDMFVQRATELGARVLDLSANGDDTVQISDVEKLITNGVDVLVIVPHDGRAMAKAVRMAHDAGIPVVAYDRIIRDSDLDLYVSFDNVKVGELQARYLVDHLPTPGKGRIVRLYGAKTDNNAHLFKQGQDNVLAPYIERGDIVVVHEDWVEEWKPENAKRIVNAAISAQGNAFDAVLASNDGTAGGAIQALLEEGLAGKKLVTGQDAELVACQRIVNGTQAMTIYKPLKILASNAADLAVRIAQRKVVVAPQTVNNGTIDVPSVLSDVVTVTKDNMVDTVIKDGLHSFDDVYRGVPENLRPAREGLAGKSSGDALLSTHGVVKRFGGVIALKGVSFDLRAGEIHALCGENGAGKSTLINLLGGVYPHGSYEGEIFVGGKPARFATPRDAEHAGIAVIHQELALFADMSVAENLLLGRLPRRLGVVNWDEVHARASEILGACGVDLDPETLVGDLGVASRQLVEIARAVAKRPKVLVLDEPTAALASQEIERLLALVRDLRSRSVACIYISHKLDEVFSIADRITVLRDGQSISTLSAAQTNPAEVIRLMVGRTIEDLYPRRSSTPGGPLLEIEALNVAERPGVPPFLRDLSLAVHAGEVLGIGGLMGAGRSELLMHLFGVWGHRVTGRVLLNGAPMPTPTPASALQSGLALVTEDRKRFGLVMEHGVTFNLSLSSLQRLVRHLLLQQDAEIARARTFVKVLNIKTHTLDSPVQTLSGGNQQKVVIGRSLMTEPGVLLLDEPTRGIDVGAKLEVYELVNRLTDEGKGIVLVSSELSELLGLSDRIVMLCEGRVGGEFSRSEATQEKLLAAAMGRTAEAA